MKLIAALSKHLRLPGETLGAFASEVKKLTDKDREDLREAFEAEGVDIED